MSGRPIGARIGRATPSAGSCLLNPWRRERPDRPPRFPAGLPAGVPIAVRITSLVPP
ncbi:hypothetical protein [Nonomuraea salmonea]|uniref:hypothetical protein n=1 Tax=Nonomuraea salmonea TaxID=46181 RepID=UPI002FEBA86C